MIGDKGFKAFFKSKLFILLMILIGLVAIFSVWALAIGGSFFSSSTLMSIVDSLTVTSFLAIGAGCLMVSGAVDLSASQVGVFGGVLFPVCMKYWHLPTPLALVITLVACGMFGLLNAVLVNEFKFQPFIATLATAMIVKGVMMFVSIDPETSMAATVNYSNAFTKFLGTHNIGGFLPVSVILMVVAFVVYGLILSKTAFGKKTYLVGGNPEASRLTGISPKRISYTLFVNCSMLAGVAGILLMARTSQGNVQALSTNQFTGLTAAVLGGISFGGGTGNLAGVFTGLLILNTFSKGMTIVKFDTYWTSVLSGLLLLVALTIDYFSRTKAKRLKGINGDKKGLAAAFAGLGRK